MAELLAAIGRALGRDGPYEEIVGEREQAISLGTGTAAPISVTREVLGGAATADGGRVAWVELRSDTPVDGYVPVEIDLRVAAGGALLGVFTVDTYNPYFGCQVGFAGWYGDQFLLVYREKHQTRLSRTSPPYESDEQVVLTDAWFMADDAVYFADDGVLGGYELPSLRPVIPTLVPAPEVREIWSERAGEARIASVPTFWHETVEEYRAQRERALAAAVAIRLPPQALRMLPAETPAWRARWEAIAIARGVPAAYAAVVVEAVGAPWLRWSPQEDRAGSGRGAVAEEPKARSAFNEAVGHPLRVREAAGWCLAHALRTHDGAAAAVHQVLRTAHEGGTLVHGWPGKPTVDENLDALFVARLAQLGAPVAPDKD